MTTHSLAALCVLACLSSAAPAFAGGPRPGTGTGTPGTLGDPPPQRATTDAPQRATTPAPVPATTPQTEPRAGDLALSIGGGAVVRYALESPDASFAWTAGVRLGLHRHLAVEAELSRWSDRNTVIPSGGGPPDPNPVVSSEWGRSSSSVGFNLLARTAGRTVSAWGGAGIGFYRLQGWQAFRFRSGAEESYSGTAINSGIQFLGGLDAVVAPRWRAFAAMRLEVPYARDFGSTVPTLTAGVRVVF